MSIRRGLAVGGATAVAAVLLGGVLVRQAAVPPVGDEASTPRAALVDPPADAAGPPLDGRDGRPGSTIGAPRRIVIPRLGVDAAVVAKAADGGTFVAPDDAQVLGWWADGARPGDRRGSALVAGHTLHGDRGALHDLETLAVGDRISVATGEGVVRYRVRSVVVLTKRQVAARATRLFSQDVPGRLVVVTCEMWNGRRFVGNAVVTADPVRGVRRADL